VQRVLSFLMVSVAVLLAAGAALLIVAQGLVATCPEGGD
jgi:hypothetical protein